MITARTEYYDAAWCITRGSRSNVDGVGALPEQRCRICDRSLPPRVGRRGRTPLYCSPACRQVAYRTRRAAPSDETLRQQITEVARRAGRLPLHPPEALYPEVAALSAAISKLRRMARARRALDRPPGP